MKIRKRFIYKAAEKPSKKTLRNISSALRSPFIPVLDFMIKRLQNLRYKAWYKHDRMRTSKV